MIYVYAFQCISYLYTVYRFLFLQLSCSSVHLMSYEPGLSVECSPSGTGRSTRGKNPTPTPPPGPPGWAAPGDIHALWSHTTRRPLGTQGMEGGEGMAMEGAALHPLPNLGGVCMHVIPGLKAHGVMGCPGPGGAGGHQAEPEPAVCPCSKEGQQHPGLHLAKCCQQVSRGDPSSLCSSSETTLCAGEEEAQGDLISVYKDLKGGSKEVRARLSSAVPRDGTRGKGHKLKYQRFSLNIRKHFLTV